MTPTRDPYCKGIDSFIGGPLEGHPLAIDLNRIQMLWKKVTDKYKTIWYDVVTASVTGKISSVEPTWAKLASVSN